MNDCARIAALFDVYLDDEATVETNVMVQQHVEHCEACARRLHELRELRMSMRQALGRDAAPEALYRRVRTAVAAPPRPSLASFIRSWIVPATATALVAWIVVPWRPAEPEAEMASAVGAHVLCALERNQQLRDASYYRFDRVQTSMPLIPNAGGQVRVIDAHTCGQQRDYTHVVLEEGNTRASVLIARAGEGAERTFGPERRSDYDVSMIRTTWHRAFIVVDPARSRALREWRAPAMERVRAFLKQVEGT